MPMFEPLRIGCIRASNAVRAGMQLPAFLTDGCPTEPAFEGR
jgi:hypothetical protein